MVLVLHGRHPKMRPAVNRIGWHGVQQGSLVEMELVAPCHFHRGQSWAADTDETSDGGRTHVFALEQVQLLQPQPSFRTGRPRRSTTAGGGGTGPIDAVIPVAVSAAVSAAIPAGVGTGTLAVPPHSFQHGCLFQRQHVQFATRIQQQNNALV